MQVIDRPDFAETSTQILHPGSRKLFRYWESLRAERACPRKDEIELKKIIDLVPFLTIIERNELQKSWNFRLAGTKIFTLFGKEMTHADSLEGFDSFERGVVGNCLDISLKRLQPILVRMRFISEQGQVVAAEMIGLPIRIGADGATQIFGGLFPFIESNSQRQVNFVRRELVTARMIWTEHEAGDGLLNSVGRKAPARFKVIEGGLR